MRLLTIPTHLLVRHTLCRSSSRWHNPSYLQQLRWVELAMRLLWRHHSWLPLAIWSRKVPHNLVPRMQLSDCTISAGHSCAWITMHLVLAHVGVDVAALWCRSKGHHWIARTAHSCQCPACKGLIDMITVHSHPTMLSPMTRVEPTIIYATHSLILRQLFS